MDKLSDANSALVHYIEALLSDDDSIEVGKDSDRCGPGESAAMNRVSEINKSALRALLFKVAGIPLAISVEDISGVLVGKETAFLHQGTEDNARMRTFRYRGRDIDLLDLRKLILPNGHPQRLEDGSRDGGHIIVLSGHDVGFICDQAGDVVDLEPQDLEWRTQRKSRAWLAGMVRGHEHALLDVKELMQGLGSRNFIN